jgi:hypothetical protein
MQTVEPCAPLTYKLRPEEVARLRELAEAAGIGPSTYAAETVRRAIGTARRRPLPRRRDELAEAVRVATGQLGRLGNNLNQIARSLNSGGPVDGTALTSIRAGLEAIDARLAALGPP